MFKCKTCKKNIFFGKKCYSYPGNKKDLLKITSEKVECKGCFSENFSKNIIDEDEIANLLLMMKDERYKEALKILEKIFNKDSSADWYSKGNIYNNLNQPEKALKCYDGALLIDTHYVKAWYRKGLILRRIKKNFKDSTICFKNVVDLEGRMPRDSSLSAKNWYFAGMFNLMISSVSYHYSLNKNKKLEKKEKKKMIKEADILRNLSLSVLYVPLIRTYISKSERDGQRNPFEGINPDNFEGVQKFVDVCTERFFEILEILEPIERENVRFKIILPGSKH